MKQTIVVKDNGDFYGICPKCSEWRKLEYAHHEYAGRKYTVSSGMYLCHLCNMNEKKVNPEKTTKERSRIARRDYQRRNYSSLSMSMGSGTTIRIEYNVKTGLVNIYETTQKKLWSGNVGTDYPEILTIIDGKIQEE